MAGTPPPPRPRSRAPIFEPRFTLVLAYLAFFFMLFCLLMVLPDLLELANTMPPGPELEKAAEETARRSIKGKILPAFALALLTSALAGYYGVLPGLRERR